MAVGVRTLGNGQSLRPTRRLYGAKPGMGAAQNQHMTNSQYGGGMGANGNNVVAGRPPQPGAAPSYAAPAPAYTAPTPQVGAPTYQGGAAGVYSYQIPQGQNMGTSMDTGFMSGLGALNANFNKLPLTPEMALGQAGLLSQFQNSMAGINAGYGQIGSQYNLGMSRMGTDQARANEGLGSSMADRGILDLGSGAAAQGYANQATDFNRQRQDMTLAAQAQQAELVRQAQAAYGSYGQGLSGLALDSARYSSGNPAY